MYGHLLEEVDYGMCKIPTHIANKKKPTLLHIFVARMSHSCKPGELQILGRKNPSTCKAMNQPDIYWNREYTCFKNQKNKKNKQKNKLTFG